MCCVRCSDLLCVVVCCCVVCCVVCCDVLRRIVIFRDVFWRVVMCFGELSCAALCFVAVYSV